MLQSVAEKIQGELPEGTAEFSDDMQALITEINELWDAHQSAWTSPEVLRATKGLQRWEVLREAYYEIVGRGDEQGQSEASVATEGERAESGSAASVAERLKGRNARFGGKLTKKEEGELRKRQKKVTIEKAVAARVMDRAKAKFDAAEIRLVELELEEENLNALL